MQFPDSQKVDPQDRANFDADVTAINMEWIEAICVGTQMKHGFCGLFGNGILNSSQELGPTRHNYHIWIERIHNEFDPMNLANPPSLRTIDALLNLAPWLLNEEYRQTQQRIANSGWKDE
jgi:hypothetical protein